MHQLPSRWLGPIASLALCASLAWSGPAAAQASHEPEHGTSGAAGMDFMAVMKQGHEQMSSMPMTGNPDEDFAMMMRMHHMAGIRMAEIELREGKDARTRDLARKIIASQKKEIRQFEDFLAKHGHSVDRMKK